MGKVTEKPQTSSSLFLFVSDVSIYFVYCRPESKSRIGETRRRLTGSCTEMRACEPASPATVFGIYLAIVELYALSGDIRGRL